MLFQRAVFLNQDPHTHTPHATKPPTQLNRSTARILLGHRTHVLCTLAHGQALPGVVPLAQRHHDRRHRRRGAHAGGGHGGLRTVSTRAAGRWRRWEAQRRRPGAGESARRGAGSPLRFFRGEGGGVCARVCVCMRVRVCVRTRVGTSAYQSSSLSDASIPFARASWSPKCLLHAAL